MSYKVVAIIAIAMLRVRDNVVAFKGKKDAKRKKCPRRGGGGSNRNDGRVWLHSVERGGGCGDRGQWLAQGLLRFELKFDAAPRRRFLPT